MERTFFDNVNLEKELSEAMSLVKKSKNPETGDYGENPTNNLMALLSSFISPEFVKISNQISLKKATIVVIEESLIENNYDRSKLEYSVIIKKTKIQFRKQITNRNIRALSTLDDFHPENPCLYFDTTTTDEDLSRINRMKKHHYKIALIEILENKDWLIRLKQAELNLSETLSEVKFC
jgi:hypothetical protein